MSVTHRGKKWVSFTGRLLVSTALLGYLYTKIDVAKTAEIIRSADMSFLWATLTIFVAINVVILFRWLIFIRALKLDAPFQSVTRYFALGLFGNLFLPSAIGGDLIKTVGLCHKRSGKAKVVASVILDRLTGFGSMVTVSTAAFIIGYPLLKDMSLLAVIALVAGVSGLAGFVLFNEKMYTFCCRVFALVPKLQHGLMNVHYDLVLLKGHKRSMLYALGVSVLAHSSLSFVWFLLAKSLHQDIPIVYFFIFVPFTCFASSFPTIGGLGAREAAAVYLFSKVGVDPGISISVSLINYLLMVLAGVLGGLVYLAVPSCSPETVPAPADAC